LDMLCDSGYPTYVLGTWVRERKALTLEEAVRRMTSDPADFFGIKNRGRLKAGMAADVAIFDPASVGSVGRPERRYDLPGAAKRKVRDVVNKPSDPDPGFNALDKNDDGFISRAEARGNPFLEKQFKSADSNHDGKLSRAEYLAVMTKKDLSTAKAKTEHALDK